MAAPKTTVATHSEQQFLEIAGYLQGQETAELAKTTPAITARRVNVTPNLNAGTVLITATLPITVAQDTDGGLSFDADEVLPSA